MNTKENLSGGEEVNEGASQWDDVEFPEFSPEGESENKEQGAEEEAVDIDQLAQDLIAARKDAKEGATWDKEQRAYIGADGLPRDWAHLVGYLKKNPDAIKTATETLQSLQTSEAPAEEVAEESPAEGPAGTEGDDIVAKEAIETPVEEAAETEDTEVETELDRRSQAFVDYFKDDYSKNGVGHPSLVMGNYRTRKREMLDKVSERVQKAFTLGESKRKLSMTEAELNDAHAKLDEMPRLTLPWSKNGREKRELRRTIRQKEKLADKLADTIADYTDEFSKEPLSKKEQATVDAIESIPKNILKGAEVERKRLQAKLELIEKAEKQLELPEDKRDWDLLEQVKPHAQLLGDESVRKRIAEDRKNITDTFKLMDEEYAPLAEEQKAA